MEAEATVETIMHTIHPHPTLSEVTVKDSTRFTVWQSMHRCELREPGRVEYGRAFEVQQELVGRRKAGEIPDQLLLLEHPHTITMGRNGHAENLLADEETLARAGIAFHRTDRGGTLPITGRDRWWATPSWTCANGSATWGRMCGRSNRR